MFDAHSHECNQSWLRDQGLELQLTEANLKQNSWEKEWFSGTESQLE